MASELCFGHRRVHALGNNKACDMRYPLAVFTLAADYLANTQAQGSGSTWQKLRLCRGDTRAELLLKPAPAVDLPS